MNPLSASDLTFGIGERLFVDHQDLVLREGERVGIVGRNGAGKSTLLKVLLGQEHFFSGEITLVRDARIQYLPQEIALDDQATLRENILAGAADTLALIDTYEQRHPTHGMTIEKLEQRITARDGWNLELRLNELATSLSIPPLDRLAGTLSGGEKRRVALAKVLVDLPEVLLLDEPTNHLDTETIQWLEDYLCRMKASLLFVTHDRYFLDRVCTRIVELQEGKFYDYPGNYTDFLRLKAQREDELQMQEEKRQAFLRREIEWIRRGPKARGTKAWSRIKTYNETAAIAPPPVERDVELLMPPPEKFGDIIARLSDVTLSRGGKTLFEHLHLNFTAGMRLGIVGRNGLGKSSLLKLLIGELQPDAGTVRIGEKTDINYADQHRVCLDDSKTVLEDIGEGNEHVMFGNRRVAVWTYLRRFLFQDAEINTRIGELSGGERNRVVLAKILKRGGNFLILDEPTNDLDLATMRVLEESLMSFGGCVAVVSHDRYFLNRVCTDILAFEDENKLFFQHGDYQYYVEKRAERLKAEEQTIELKNAKATAAATQTPATSKTERRRLTWKEQRELEGMEEAIAEKEKRIGEIEALFSCPDFNAKYGTQTKELTTELQGLKDEVEKLFERWQELEDIQKNS